MKPPQFFDAVAGMVHATAGTPTGTTATTAAGIHGRVAATAGEEARLVEHQLLAPAQLDMPIPKVWQSQWNTNLSGPRNPTQGSPRTRQAL